MKLFFVRHGQMEVRAHQATSLEAINQFASQQSQFGLSLRGRDEAHRVAAHFARNGCDALYCSPLLRAQETAETIAATLSIPVQERREIIEVLTGALPATRKRGIAIDLLARSRVPFALKRATLGALLIPIYYHAWQSGITEGGESPEAFRARLDHFFDELRESTPRDDARVVVVAHGYLIFNLALLATSPSQKARLWLRPYIPNGGITEFTLPAPGLPRLVRYARIDHLRR